MDILWICLVGAGSASVNTPVYNEGWMVYGWATLFHCVLVSLLTLVQHNRVMSLKIFFQANGIARIGDLKLFS